MSQSSIVSHIRNTQEDVCSISGTSSVAFQSPDFYSRRFSRTSGIAYQCRDIAESRRFYVASDIACQSPDIESRRLCMPHESKYGDEYHLELCCKLDKDQDISPRHSVISSAISGVILQHRRGKSYESLQENIEDHCKEVQCIEIHALSTSKSEESSAASVTRDNDSLPSQGGVSMDLIPIMERPTKIITNAVGDGIIKPFADSPSSLLPKTPKVMASRELAQTRSSNSETRPMIVLPFSSDNAVQHQEMQLDALCEEFPVSPVGVSISTTELSHQAKMEACTREESHKSGELSNVAVQTGDILIIREDDDDDAHSSSCSPGMVQSWHQKKLLDSQVRNHPSN